MGFKADITGRSTTVIPKDETAESVSEPHFDTALTIQVEGASNALPINEDIDVKILRADTPDEHEGLTFFIGYERTQSGQRAKERPEGCS